MEIFSIKTYSTTLELLEWIKHKVNAGTSEGKKNYDTNNHKTSYTFTLEHKAVIDPFLVIGFKKKEHK